MGVITISRQYGSGGDAIAERVCTLLGYRLFDKHLIAEAAAEAGVSEQEILDYSEDHYKVKTFYERLLRSSRSIAVTRMWKEDSQGMRVAEQMSLSEEHVILLVQKAITKAYEAGNMVIVGRGGQMVLKNNEDVLHVRIEAPKEERIQRLKLQLKSDKAMPLDNLETRRAAQDIIEMHDGASEDYLRNFYGVDWADPALYHAVLNTGKLSVDLVAHMIVEMLGVLECVRVV
jgi:cytidylate kinase